jgi:hypothetical protein
MNSPFSHFHGAAYLPEPLAQPVPGGANQFQNQREGNYMNDFDPIPATPIGPGRMVSWLEKSFAGPHAWGKGMVHSGRWGERGFDPRVQAQQRTRRSAGHDRRDPPIALLGHPGLSSEE